MPRPERHVFVCLNDRPVGAKPSCAARGASELYQALQRAVGARPELWGRVAITSCGCLGPCFEGPNLVVYPEAIWYAGVGADDAEELVERHLCGGQPLERLRYTFPEQSEAD
jgi:(2Fe-2S) ferredoxin